MSKKQEFIKYVNELMYYTRKMDAPVMSEDAELYWNAFCGLGEDGEKPLFTDNGKFSSIMPLDVLRRNIQTERCSDNS